MGWLDTLKILFLYSLAIKTDTSKLPYIYAYYANIIYAVDGIRVNSLSDINRLLEKACPG